MLACLVTLTPLLSGSTDRAIINLCSAGDRRVTALGGTRWSPAITQAPALGMQFWNGDFEQGAQVGKTDFTFNMVELLRAYPDAINAVWMGAGVEVAIGKVGAPWPWATRFRGRVTSYGGDEWPTMKITADVDTEPFNLDVLSETYAGTGGAEGGADLKDKVKPLALGRPRNVEPVLINAIDSVYQFSGYGPIEAVEGLFERASAFPTSSGNYANYAALVAATIAPGRWATCLARGMVRLGAPAYGVITGDIRGHAVGGVAPTGAGALVAMLADMCGVDSALLADATLVALDAEGATDSDVMMTEQVKFLEAARRLILPCNWQVVLSNLGVMLAIEPKFSSLERFTLHAQGRREPLVKAVSEDAVSLPYKKTVMAAERNWRQQSFDEIATSAPLVDRGNYDPATVYREGNIVTMPGGARWRFISATPQAGVTPGTNPAVWESLQTAATYTDGTPIDDLQPAEAGATLGAPTGTPVGTITADDVSGTINSGGGVADDQVGTAALLANTVTGRIDFSGPDVYCPTGTETTVLESSTVTISVGGVAGSAIIGAYATLDASAHADAAIQLRLYVDTGSGYVLVETQKAGVVTNSGNTFIYLPLAVTTSVAGDTVKVKITAQPIALNGYTTWSYIEAPSISVFGGYR